MSNTADVDGYSDWPIPEFSSDKENNTSSSLNLRKGLPTAEELEGIYLQSQKEGFDKGYADGLEKAKGIIQERVNILNEITNVINDPYESIVEDVAVSIKKLSLIIAGHIVRRELTIDESHVMAAVKKSIDIFSGLTHTISLYLHPSDVDIVKELLSIRESSNIQIVEDITITRGGCKVETPGSTIDATIEGQLREISSEIIGGSRSDDD